MALAFDIPRLLSRVTGADDPRESQKLIVEAFQRRGDPIKPITVERWIQRGSIITPRMITLLRIARDHEIDVDLLDFAVEDDRIEEFKAAEREQKARAKERMETVIAEGIRAMRRNRRNRRVHRRHRGSGHDGDRA
jgi:hypothetical protein